MDRDKGKSPRQHFNYSQTLLHESDEKDSSSSEDDENAELLTEELEEGFFKVLSQLKKKDSKLYEESVKYYPGNFSEDDKRTKKKSLKDYKEWLRGQKEKIESEEIKEELKALHDFWTSPTLNKDEQFLRDYILNKKFLEQDDNFNIEEEINKLSDEEKEVEQQLIFEHKYNCRFENKDQELVPHKKSKTKRKRDNEVKYRDPNSSTCSEIELRTENVDNTEQETNTESPKRKRGKKKNKHSEIETVLEDIKIEEPAEKETDDYDTVTKHINAEHNKVTLKPYTPVKAHKFKDVIRHKRKSREKQTYEPNVSCEDVHQSQSSHPNKIFKNKNQNDIVNCTIESGKNVKSVLHQDMLKAVQNLPRNLQMKHKMGKKKMRHRNQKKFQGSWIINKVSAQTDGNTKEKGLSHTNAFNHKIKEKEQRNRPKHQEVKKSKHLQNLFVKEKKNKELRLINIKSKKHKAAKYVSKRELANSEINKFVVM